MKKTKRFLAFTLIELLVVISIIAILASLAIPAITSALVRGQMTQALNNEKQIHLACFSMSTDRISTGDSSIGWPGDVGVATSGSYIALIVSNNYLKAGDLKVFAAAGVTPYTSGSLSAGVLTPAFITDSTQATNNLAYSIFPVQESDASNAVFLATINATKTAPTVTGTSITFTLDATSKVFSDKGLVVFHRGGDGVMLSKAQASKANLIGAPGIYTASGSATLTQ